eukprot:13653437-Ditylum_brightwellii.AAC.1
MSYRSGDKRKDRSSACKSDITFESLDEAIEAANKVVYVDLDFIEKNHGYFMQQTINKRHNNELIEELSITKPSL